ncbi:ATP-binding protein [Spirosoma horti]
MNEESIREELATVLIEDGTNYSKILQLSTMLSRFDTDNIRFSVDAGVIDRLGTELVARQETAVSELVKNSYDADAKKVTLTFENSDTTGGKLTIIDDGVGMTRDQLINGFMRISSTDKVHNPLSERYNRNRSGQKGIGRFAVQRLGERLTIITQTLSSLTALRLTINWEQYKGDTDLAIISNKIEVVKKNQQEGTTLIIEALRDRWSQASIKRVYRYVSAIIQPFPLSKENDKIASVTLGPIDPGFKTSFIKIENSRKITIADETSMIYDHALSVIEGRIDDSGIGIYSIASKKLNINEIGQIGSDPEDNTQPFNLLRNVHFRAYYYVYNADLIPKMQESSIKSLAQRNGGIRLYRNGFRVLPYGEAGNDWLKLDASIRRRSILPVHGNNNFFGLVELTDKDNMFNETSSREGLIENEAFVQLQNFLYRTIITGVIRTAEVRNVKIASGQRKEGNLYEKIEISIKDIAHTIEALDKEFEEEETNIEIRKKRKNRINKLKQDIQKVASL